jgi:hypothetical protein
MTTSPFKKSILFLSLFAAAVTVAVIDIYLPAAPYLAYFFNVDFKSSSKVHIGAGLQDLFKIFGFKIEK